MITPLVQITVFAIVLAVCLQQRLWLGVVLSVVWIMINVGRLVFARRRSANNEPES
ncbi:hypothetical protein Adu01nite_35520 [Paractinoplanes durhamensis]|uniref:Uncharacterized protein n=1 Tax=Paractinoplanes durhamensis TaxID=113563 RepID=A0ABQ3YX82_9ACTN|nr:hypothetical protein Adu01nite_35520 [Actinoplanes durhamensis]